MGVLIHTNDIWINMYEADAQLPSLLFPNDSYMITGLQTHATVDSVVAIYQRTILYRKYVECKCISDSHYFS